MEKKRRARINQSLNDLKRLLLESNNVKKEVSSSSITTIQPMIVTNPSI